MIDQDQLFEELNRFAKLLVIDYAVSDALHDLVDAVTAILSIYGAGVSLAQGDVLAFATAANDDVITLERIQEQVQSGPCVDAYRSGQCVFVSDLTAEGSRWPELAEAAAGVGVVALAGIPMHLNGTKLGAVNLYDTQPRHWDDDERKTAELLAGLATGYIVNASRLDQVRHTAEQLQEALDSRVIIEQAKGILAGERGITIGEAFQVLRSHARKNNAPLRAVAEAVVNLRLRP